MKKKVLSTVLAAVLAVGVLAGCGGSSTESKGTDSSAAQSTASSSTEMTKVTVAASPTPHAKILEAAKPLMEKEGYDLEIKTFEDYIQPNEVVSSGDMDANYFQHVQYLQSYNEEHGTDLTIAGEIHYEPFAIYPGTKKDLKDIADGDTIAIPNDTTNETRALLLLQENGLITLKDGITPSVAATVNDIKDNPRNLKIEELEAAQVSRVTGEVAYVVLNGNYAMEAGLSVGKDALAEESSDSTAVKEAYVNVIAVQKGHEEDPGIKALVKVLKSQEIRDYIDKTFDGAVITFDD